MTPHRLLWWAIAIVLIVILVLVALQIARAVRELKRVNARLEGYADLPLLKALERGEGYARRLEAAAAQLEPPAARALAALAVIRKGPVPPELLASIARVRSEAAAFRSFARR